MLNGRLGEGYAHVHALEGQVVGVNQSLHCLGDRSHLDKRHLPLFWQESEPNDGSIGSKQPSEGFFRNTVWNVGDVQHGRGWANVLEVSAAHNFVTVERGVGKILREIGAVWL